MEGFSVGYHGDGMNDSRIISNQRQNDCFQRKQEKKRLNYRFCRMRRRHSDRKAKTGTQDSLFCTNRNA